MAKIRAAAPKALLVLTTVYDPTDGTGRMPGTRDLLPVKFLHIFNDRVRAAARHIPNSAFADVHGHFMGHGITAREEDRWYWSGSIIEPGIMGASEIRRIWLDAVK